MPAHQGRSHRSRGNHERLGLETPDHQGQDKGHDDRFDRVAVALPGLRARFEFGCPRRGLQSGGGPSHRQMFPLLELTRELEDWLPSLTMSFAPPGRLTSIPSAQTPRRTDPATECNGFVADREPSTPTARRP